MKTPILAMAMTAVAMPLALSATPADAQRGWNERRELRECNRELRRADSRAEYRRELRECRRELAQARRNDRWSRYGRGANERRELAECNRELRRADSRAEYRQELRECRRELAQARRADWRTYGRYDWNRPGYGNAYYADDYYRDGRYYRERQLTRADRIYRGRDGRYYCRRSDGTTGLIVGAGIGALIGNAIDGGRSSLLGTLIGAGAGAAIGAEIERGNVRCR